MKTLIVHVTSGSSLLLQVQAYFERGEPDAAPLDPELDHWLTWIERYATIAEGSRIIMLAEE